MIRAAAALVVEPHEAVDRDGEPVRQVEFGKAVVEIGRSLDQHRARFHPASEFAHVPRTRGRMVPHREEDDAAVEITQFVDHDRCFLAS